MSLLQDLRYGSRIWRKHPVPALLSIGMLAIGIAAATAIFTIVNAVLLKPLPYRDADRLVMIWGINERLGIDVERQKTQTGSISVLEYRDWLSRSGIFDNVVVWASTFPRITQTDEPVSIQVYRTSPGVFPMLGVAPLLGRGFDPQDERVGADPVIVLQHELWTRRYGRDPAVIGQKLYLANQPHTIIGVMPPDFVFFNRQMDALAPLHIQMPNDQTMRRFRGYRAMARLKEGVSIEQAQARADAFSASLAREYPETNQDWKVALLPVAEDASAELRPAMGLLLAAVVCVLLITCANVANLLLVQASARNKELAVRTAVGASRVRLVRQMLVEGLLLGIAGGAVGLATAYGIVQLFQSMVPDRTTHGKYLVQAVAMRIDPGVIAFTIGVTLVTTLIVAVIPAWRASKTDVNDALKDSSRGSSSGIGGRAVRTTLVVVEVALAALLAIGATLLVRSLVGLYDRGPGYQPSRLVAFGGVTLSREQIDDRVRREKLSQQEANKLYRAADRSFRDRLYRLLDEMPNLEGYTTATMLPLNGTYGLSQFIIEGRPQPAPGEEISAVTNVVRPGYFRVMGIPLVRGRDFGRQDAPELPQTAVVSEEFVRRYFIGTDPIGQRFTRCAPQCEPKGPWVSIVGVVGSIREDGIDQPPQAHVYFSEDQLDFFAGRIIFRARSGDTMNLVPAVRQAVKTADPQAGIYRVLRLEDEARGSIWRLSYSTLLLTGMALLATVLAVLGVYGVLSYVVRERTQEISVRMALGAGRSEVISLVIGQGLTLVGGGIVIGLIAAAALTKLLSGLLFGVAPIDPLSFLSVAVILLIAGCIASYVPARRATRVDPLIAMRY
jgi:putative ABC transport system permease protein